MTQGNIFNKKALVCFLLFEHFCHYLIFSVNSMAVKWGGSSLLDPLYQIEGDKNKWYIQCERERWS